MDIFKHWVCITVNFATAIRCVPFYVNILRSAAKIGAGITHVLLFVDNVLVKFENGCYRGMRTFCLGWMIYTVWWKCGVVRKISVRAPPFHGGGLQMWNQQMLMHTYFSQLDIPLREGGFWERNFWGGLCPPNPLLDYTTECKVHIVQAIYTRGCLVG